MKTITISIDEQTLGALNRLAEKLGVPGKRSELVGIALSEFVAQDASERAVIAKHRSLLARARRRQWSPSNQAAKLDRSWAGRGI